MGSSAARAVSTLTDVSTRRSGRGRSPTGPYGSGVNFELRKKRTMFAALRSAQGNSIAQALQGERELCTV